MDIDESDVILCPYTGLTKPCTPRCGVFVPFNPGDQHEPRNSGCGVLGYCGHALPAPYKQHVWPAMIVSDPSFWVEGEEEEDPDGEGTVEDAAPQQHCCADCTQPVCAGERTAAFICTVRPGPAGELGCATTRVLVERATALLQSGEIVGWRRTDQYMEVLLDEAPVDGALFWQRIAPPGEDGWVATTQRNLAYTATVPDRLLQE